MSSRHRRNVNKPSQDDTETLNRNADSMKRDMYTGEVIGQMKKIAILIHTTKII